jgi:N-acetylglutamate synthase-like GNAT family acetyltransferase
LLLWTESTTPWPFSSSDVRAVMERSDPDSRPEWYTAWISNRRVACGQLVRWHGGRTIEIRHLLIRPMRRGAGRTGQAVVKALARAGLRRSAAEMLYARLRVQDQPKIDCFRAAGFEPFSRTAWFDQYGIGPQGWIELCLPGPG